MSVCEQCSKEFSCAMQDAKDDTPCWCTAMPKLALEDMPANSAAASRCLCPECLRKWIDSRTTN